MNSRKKVIVASIVTILLVSAVVLLLRRQSTPQQPDSIKIGVLLPLTGNSAFLGEEERKGVEAIKAQLERQHGKTITLIYEDSKNDATTGVNGFVKLWQVDKVDAVIVTHTGVNSSLSEYVAKNSNTGQPLPVILATITSAPQITRNNNLFLRVFVSGEDETYATATFAADNLKCRRAAVFYQNDDYGVTALNQFRSNFQGKGGQIVRETAYEKEPKDLRSLVAGLKESKPECVFVAGNTAGAVLLLRELRERKTEQPLLTNAVLDSKSFRENAGEEAIKDIYYLTFFAETEQIRQSSPFQEFRAGLERQGTSPNTFTVFTALCLELYVNSKLKWNNLGAEQLVQTIATNQHQSMIGTIRFDAARSALLPVSVRQAKAVAQTNDLLLETYTRP
jgi:branched-chain amino acid transport system substrate-binding protein